MPVGKPGFTKKWSLFLRWWIIFMLICVGSVMLSINGVTDKVHEADFTRISFGIYVIFIGFTIKNGIKAFSLCRNGPNLEENDFVLLFRGNEFSWFVADGLLTLGMIGTVLGFIFMLSTSFAGVTVLNTIALQGALTKMSLGMSTALYTTASGLICSLILKLQLFDFTNYLKKTAELCGCEVINEVEN